MRLCETPISAEELAELKSLHLTLPWLRHKPWAAIESNPVILGCLRNCLLAARRAKAARAALAPENFELVP